MNFVDAVKTCFSKYACFEGRACRSEYWYFCLFNFLLGIVCGALLGKIGSSIVSLALFIPSLAVAVRRLHDVGKSGWFYLLCLIPLIGWIWLIVLYCTPGNAEANQYGENPLNQQVAE